MTAELIKPSGMILDVGCGSGISSRAYMNYGRVTGVDISEGMVKRAHERGVTTVIADAEDLPFRNGSFDYVIFSASIFLLPHPEIAMREAMRVISENGCVGGNYPVGFFDGEIDLIKKSGLTHRLVSERDKIEEIVKKVGGDIKKVRFTVTPEFIIDFYSIPSMGKAILRDIEPGKRMITIRKIFSSPKIPEKLDYLWEVFKIDC